MYAPWMSKTTSQIKNPNVKLHNEIIEFSNYVQPDPKDSEKREKAIEQVEELKIRSLREQHDVKYVINKPEPKILPPHTGRCVWRGFHSYPK